MSSKSGKDIFQMAMNTGNNAPLQTAKKPTGTRAKSIRAIPAEYFEMHDQLKKNRKTSLDLSAYMIEALREKLERDGAEFDEEGR